MSNTYDRNKEAKNSLESYAKKLESVLVDRGFTEHELYLIRAANVGHCDVDREWLKKGARYQ